MALSSQSSIVVNERMDLETTRFTLKWTIDKFKKLLKKSEYLRSVGITMQELGRDDFPGRWSILVKPCSTKTEEGVSKSYVGVFLSFTDVGAESVAYTSSGSVDAEFVISIYTGKEEAMVPLYTLQRRLEHTFCRNEQDWGFERMISHDSLFGDDKKPGVLKDESSLTFIIEVTMYGEPKAVTPPEIVAADSSKLYQQFVQCQAKALVGNSRPHFTDFTICSSSGQKFPTYRVLLTSHSPVFAAMLSHDSQENQLSRCELKDIDGETVGVLLDYVRGCDTGKVTLSNAEKVLIMADKYEILDLRAVCEGMLARSVTAENAVHYLVLASQRKLDTLQQAALNVIPKNMDTVLKNGALQEALQFDPDLMQTIMEHCSKKMRRGD